MWYLGSYLTCGGVYGMTAHCISELFDGIVIPVFVSVRIG